MWLFHFQCSASNRNHHYSRIGESFPGLAHREGFWAKDRKILRPNMRGRFRLALAVKIEALRALKTRNCFQRKLSKILRFHGFVLWTMDITLTEKLNEKCKKGNICLVNRPMATGVSSARNTETCRGSLRQMYRPQARRHVGALPRSASILKHGSTMGVSDKGFHALIAQKSWRRKWGGKGKRNGKTFGCVTGALLALSIGLIQIGAIKVWALTSSGAMAGIRTLEEQSWHSPNGKVTIFFEFWNCY